MAPARILVVDDNDVVRGVVSQMLSRLGHEVSAADSGEKGFNVFMKNNFDIVLSDYEMPGLDGVALAYRIKQFRSGVAVGIMTGSGQENMINGNTSSVDEVIAKPFSLDALDGMIRNLQGKLFRAYP